MCVWGRKTPGIFSGVCVTDRKVTGNISLIGYSCKQLLRNQKTFLYILQEHEILNSKKDIAIPLQAWTGPKSSRSLRLLEFLENLHTKVIKLSALRTGRIYFPGKSLVLISVRGRVDARAIVRPERLSRLRIPITSTGMEPVTFWLLAQCLNHLRHRVPRNTKTVLYCQLNRDRLSSACSMNRLLRRIVEPKTVEETGGRRTLHSDKFHNVNLSLNAVGVIRSTRMFGRRVGNL
jgi:hypothetical protein